ncbi:Pls/PosA family non-ribosomal peptide synthetase [Streptomyces sp. NPDC059575]|uniref:Pls/PosA family non-ribosomal peptide synthetase n=1 Tax=Streptomyces sp. NPDC059575 TaxID=3346872 RepID=UPI0036BAF102
MVEQSSEVHPETDREGPEGGAVTRCDSPGPARADTETRLAEVLAGVLGVENISPDGNFFDDLGANSLVMAQFCARVRKRGDLPSPSMKDVYQHPTLRGLATVLDQSAQPLTEAPAPVSPLVRATPPEPVKRASRASHVLCGTFQTLCFLGYSLLAGFSTAAGYEWVAAGSGLWDIYLRSLLFGGAGFLVLCAIPVVAKWVLIGRWKSAEFPVWSAAYLRFWVVKSLLHANPMLLFVGNPLYVLYLRALGARIGKGVTILSHSMPVCTDLVTIGSGTIVRKDTFLLGYRAHTGRIQTGRITLGRDVYIGEKTILDIDTSMGDGAQLGHSSSLHRGQSVPDGEHRHGSPAQATEVDYLRVAPAPCGTLRRTWFGCASLLQLLLLYIPLGVGGMYMLFTEVPAIRKRLEPAAALTLSELAWDSLILSLVLFAGFVVLGFAALCTLPRLLSLVVRPDRVYPLYGFPYAVHRATARMTNVKFFAWLFGDSSYIVNYLRAIGYDLSHVEQTGSNFGTEMQHESPLLVTVGSGTMVADGLSVVNADYSATSFRLSRVTIGAHNFLGNNIAYPTGGRTGENCLLATKVMVPLDGEVREGVGLLGSPCFEIPRTVERDARFDHLRSGDTLRRSLAAKNRYNLRSMALMLFVRWLHVLALTFLALATVNLYGMVGHFVIAGYMALTLLLSTLYYIVVERCLLSFRRLRPQLCSIYDPSFWKQERLWKIPDQHLNIFNGTPYKTLIWRLMGVRIGRGVFDDGAFITERTLTAIGDGATLNAGCKIQCHSQEDGTFKSAVTRIGADCTLGVAAHVHYGVKVGDGAVLAPDSFLMKGEEVPPHARWGGNPAADLPETAVPPAGPGRRTPPSLDNAAATTVS